MCRYGYAGNASTRFTINFTEAWDVNWSENYKREERATWEDIAGMIRDSVTMSNAIEAYTPEYIPRNRRMPCPIHNGKDYNFSFTTTGFRCFVCNESGDVIEFTRLVRGLKSRTDAMKLLNKDFYLHLPLDREITGEESFVVERRRKAAAEREQEQKRLFTIYHSALNYYTFLDKMKQDFKPKTEDDITYQYVYACRRIDAAWHDVECAADAIHEFDKRQKAVVTN